MGLDLKRTRRRDLLAERRSTPASEVASLSQRVIDNLLSLSELGEARTVLLYAADPDEVDLTALLDAAPPRFRMLLPRIESGRLVPVTYSAGDPLAIGTFGVREPSGPAVEPGDAGIDTVIVPGVAFSAAGGRLGRGRGLYDRFLPQLPDAVRIGVCAERFVIDGLPLEEHDVMMDLVVSDAAVRRPDEASRRRGAVDGDVSA